MSPVLFLCRHPRETAIPRAVWRGSTSDPLINAIELSNIASIRRYEAGQGTTTLLLGGLVGDLGPAGATVVSYACRFHLHVLSDVYPEVLDARITKVQPALCLLFRNTNFDAYKCNWVPFQRLCVLLTLILP